MGHGDTVCDGGTRRVKDINALITNVSGMILACVNEKKHVMTQRQSSRQWKVWDRSRDLLIYGPLTSFET